VLERDVEVTGPIAVSLWAATDAADTDWTAALVDVYPDGRAIILCEGICRARYRDELAPPVLVPPGVPTQFTIDCWATSNAFLAGHRIRLEVSSSNFPRFDRNLNTGGRVGFETEWQVAHQQVFHDAEHPSRLVLPVIPAS
jgi:putative CocE/NonD family hydrolase